MERRFTVDARLLRELGERLVGRPHIALAELIKNAWDADARNVEITFRDNLIRIADDGHGMTEQRFVDRWMRIGTTAKSTDEFSPGLLRQLTGSKGVGRLAVQLLATRLDLRSVGLDDPGQIASLDPPILAPEIMAGINWPDAMKHEQLTDVTVEFDSGEPRTHFANGSTHGTEIELSGLMDDWSAEDFESLAQEIWVLQPPFQVSDNERDRFNVTLDTPYPDIQETFEAQMRAVLDINTAEVRARLLPAGASRPKSADFLTLSVSSTDIDEEGEIRSSTDSLGDEGGDQRVLAPSRLMLIEVSQLSAPDGVFAVEIPNCQIDKLSFEFKVFNLKYRQSMGIKVGEARAYLNKFGGVSIYDSGFRLPYYGPDTDWLRLELDHARRLSRSQLLPEAFQVRDGMQDLPSNKRVFGSARISTSSEQRSAIAAGRRPGQALAIQITRDRLVDNLAFRQMTRAVRMGFDLYALCRAKTKSRKSLTRRRGPDRPKPTEAVKTASDVVDAIKEDIPHSAYTALRDSIDTLAEESERQVEEGRAYASLLGALATAGMISLAYEHEVSKQRGGIKSVATLIRGINLNGDSESARLVLEQAAEDLSHWIDRSEQIRDIFGHLLDEESRTTLQRYRAKSVVRDLVRTMQVITKTAEVDINSIPTDLRLPSGSYAAWMAVLQNLLLNASRATLSQNPALIKVDGGEGSERWLRVQDNGVGVDLDEADGYFEPFARSSREASEAALEEALGLGGSGLGLTIVRMITDELRVTARFTRPEPGWATAITLSWRD